MKRLTLAISILLLAFSVIGFAQNTNMQMGAEAAAVVGHPPAPFSGVHIGPNTVIAIARHCQRYVLPTGDVDVEKCAADPSTTYWVNMNHNLVTNAGFTAIEKMISDTAAQPAACNYIALANDTSNTNVGTVAVGDTTIATSGTASTEIAANGLTRAQGTFTADSPGSKQYTVAKVFTGSGTQASNKTGLFNASSGGTMCYEALYTQVTINNADTLTVSI